MRIFILLFFATLVNISFSQERAIRISGKVFLDSIPREAAVVTIISNLKETSGITNQKGEFSFEGITLKKEEDSIVITSSYFGYLPFKKTYTLNKQNSLLIDIHLQGDIQKLDEVIIKDNGKAITKDVNKLSYQIQRKNFIKNTKAPDVLNTVPSLSYHKSKGVTIEGDRGAKIYVDGLETDITDLETIDVSEMEIVEVLYNPSARYGAEFTGGIINIVTKKREKLYYKGFLKGGKGVLLKSTSYMPQLTLKTNKFILKGYFIQQENRQEVNFDLDRQLLTTGESYIQQSFREPKVIQKWGSLKTKYELTETDNVFLNGSYVNNSAEGVFNGIFRTNSSIPIQFSNNKGNEYERFTANGVYEKKIKKNVLYIKGKYLMYSREDFYQIAENEVQQSALESKSQFDELSGEITYEIPSVNMLKKDVKLDVGTKYINRKYSFVDDPFSLRQNIVGLFSDFSFSFNKSYSLFTSLYYEYANNKNETLNQTLHYFLPTINLKHKIGKKSNLEASFSRRIMRPNSYDLNDNEILLNPGVIERGNEDLRPQTQNNYVLRYSKSLRNRGYLSVKAYYENIDNAILQSISQRGDVLIYSKDNIGQVKKYGVALGYNTTFFKVLMANTNIGLSYNKFESLGVQNSGATFYGNIFLSTRLLKNKLSLSFFGSTHNPKYDFISRTTTFPFTSLSASTNILKNKISLSLEYSDLFRLNSKIKTVIDNTALRQITNIRTNFSNINLNISYNFGDSFNDRYKEKLIRNTDIKD
ncbi:TonB-dependent receptor [Aquimarina algiphila]|uniref:TonB-dependent receptor n=1 Tax=Aquimarina algiphila TaxID=2047982 RepID=UPI00232D2220|nr:outer membrane beta-barrel protein [Aquimarina algiphila]